METSHGHDEAPCDLSRRPDISAGGGTETVGGHARCWPKTTADHLVLRPVPDDPLAAVRGALTAEMSGGPATDQLRAGARAEEAAIEAMRPDGVPKTSSE